MGYTLPSGLEVNRIEEIIGNFGAIGKAENGPGSGSVNATSEPLQKRLQKKGKEAENKNIPVTTAKKQRRAPEKDKHLFTNEQNGEWGIRTPEELLRP